MSLLSSKSQHLTFVAVSFVALGLFGWFQLGGHGVVHDMIYSLNHAFMLAAGVAFVIYGNASPQLKYKARVRNEAGEIPAIGTRAEHVSRLTHAVHSCLALAKWLPVSIEATIGFGTLRAVKLLGALLTAFLSLELLADSYFYGGTGNWINCLMVAATAYCFAMSYVLYKPEEWEHRGKTPTPSFAEVYDSTFDDEDRTTALIKLLLSLVTLSGTIGWFVKALKHDTLNNWWAFACFAGAFWCATASFAILERRVACAKVNDLSSL